MRVLLCNPPFYRLLGSHFNGIMLGQAYIAAVLKQAGHEVYQYQTDAGIGEYSDLIELFASYDEYKESLYNLELPIWKEIRSVIESVEPDIVGVTILTGTFKSGENVAKIVKEVNKSITVIAGGAHPTLSPIDVVQNPYFDYAVRGEGEYTLLELYNFKEQYSVKGLVYKNKNRIIVNPKRNFIRFLDDLPFPSRDGFVGNKNVDVSYLITARGCPFECTFCASPKIWERQVRYRIVDCIVREIEVMRNEYNCKSFRIVDDSFNLNINRAKILCRKLLTLNPSIEWTCDARLDCLDLELLELMKQAGCTRIKLGVESGSDKILKAIKKGFTVKQVLEACKLVKKVDIPLTMYIMAGFPEETDEDLKETVDLVKEIEPDYASLSIVTPYPGTQYHSEWESMYHQSRRFLDGEKRSLVDEILSYNKGERT